MKSWNFSVRWAGRQPQILEEQRPIHAVFVSLNNGIVNVSRRQFAYAAAYRLA